MKILIVDDENLVRRALSRVFLLSKYEVYEAKDGEEGLAMWRALQPNYILLDVLMPKLSGPQIIEQIETEFKISTRIVLMSAYSAEHNMDTAKKMGADLFIAKPFDDVFAIVKKIEDIGK